MSADVTSHLEDGPRQIHIDANRSRSPTTDIWFILNVIADKWYCILLLLLARAHFSSFLRGQLVSMCVFDHRQHMDAVFLSRI